MLPSETMIWQPEFTDKTLSRKPGAVHFVLSNGFWAHSPSVALLAFHNEITGFLIAYTTTSAGKITDAL
ncbi:TPA: hypothetical protein IB093_004152 [Escherichia coli]|nr:hypothetical protein [Escherichia coli]